MQRVRPAPDWLTWAGCLTTAIGYVSDWHVRENPLQGTGGFANWGDAQDGINWAIWPIVIFSIVSVAALWSARNGMAATAVLAGGVAAVVLVGAQLAVALAPSGPVSPSLTPASLPGVGLLGLGLGLIVAGGVRTSVLSLMRHQAVWGYVPVR